MVTLRDQDKEDRLLLILDALEIVLINDSGDQDDSDDGGTRLLNWRVV